MSDDRTQRTVSDEASGESDDSQLGDTYVMRQREKEIDVWRRSTLTLSSRVQRKLDIRPQTLEFSDDTFRQNIDSEHQSTPNSCPQNSETEEDLL